MVFLRFFVTDKLDFTFRRNRISFALRLCNLGYNNQIAANISDRIIIKLYAIEQIAILSHFSSNDCQLCSSLQLSNLFGLRTGFLSDIYSKLIRFSSKWELHQFIQKIRALGNHQIIRQCGHRAAKQYKTQPQTNPYFCSFHCLILLATVMYNITLNIIHLKKTISK